MPYKVNEERKKTPNYRQLELLKKNQETLTALKKNLIEDTETNS